MNWRGLWTNTTQFYQNDVVLSPITTAPYLLTRLALLGGLDPSLVPANWTELAPATGGITGLTAGNGISITGTPTIPQLNNTGVLQVVAGTGITNVGTASQPELRNTGLISLNVGTGLASSGGQTPTLTNTGVLSITTTAGSGITITGSSNAPTVVNSGILAVNAGAGITIAPVPSANQPTIANTGVISITAGSGIIISGPPQTPTISSSAIAADPVATTIPLSSIFVPIPAGATGTNVLSLSPTSLLAQHLASGSPDPNGTWILDLTSFVFLNIIPAGGTQTITTGVEDNTTVGGPYTYTGVVGTGTTFLNTPPCYVSLNKFFLNVADARTAGLRDLNLFLVSNDTGGDLLNTGAGVITATYYPNGV
jgi:uncharacterized protein YjeT (DUF2065 family)